MYDQKEELLYARPDAQSLSSGSSSSLANPGPSGANNGGQGGSNGGAPAQSARNEADDFDLLPDARINAYSGEDYFLLNS